jgi:hypothetical protein
MFNLIVIAIVTTGFLFYMRTIFASNDILTLAILFSAFLAAYVILVLASKSLDENDWGIIKSAWNKIFLKR